MAVNSFAGGGSARVLVNEGQGLNSGDQFQIYFKTNQDCYVYVINIDSHGNVFSAFPNKEGGITDNFLKKNVRYTLPTDELYYSLDSNPGVETIFFIGSYEPMQDIDFILDNLEGSQEQQIAMRGPA